jgi:two-component system, OmpR family, alkaline phosphatase synthesis response regulator PhoP
MPSDNGKVILIIEDEAHIAEGLKLNLELQGYAATIAVDGPAGLQQWKALRPDLIVLDIMLPGIDGLSVLQRIRLEDERLPILVLSAKAASEDKVKGLALGVDDYLSKPFNLEEFLLRVERLLTRSQWGHASASDEILSTGAGPDSYRFGENQIDFVKATARCQQGHLHLTE